MESTLSPSPHHQATPSWVLSLSARWAPTPALAQEGPVQTPGTRKLRDVTSTGNLAGVWGGNKELEGAPQPQLTPLPVKSPHHLLSAVPWVNWLRSPPGDQSGITASSTLPPPGAARSRGLEADQEAGPGGGEEAWLPSSVSLSLPGPHISEVRCSTPHMGFQSRSWAKGSEGIRETAFPSKIDGGRGR